MTMQMLLAAAKPWTYWIAPPFLMATLALIVILAAGYYRKVMVPAYRLRLETEKRHRSREANGDVRPLRPKSPASAERLAA